LITARAGRGARGLLTAGRCHQLTRGSKSGPHERDRFPSISVSLQDYVVEVIRKKLGVAGTMPFPLLTRRDRVALA